MGGFLSCLGGPGLAEAEAKQSRQQQQASTADHPTTISSKTGPQTPDAEDTASVPWQNWEDVPWQEHVPQPHANKQQQHQVHAQHNAKPAVAAAACPAARVSSSTSNHSCASSMHSMLARLPSHGPQQQALLGFPSEPWMPLNPHESGPPRPACEDARLAVATCIAQLLDSVPAEPLDSLLQLASSMFNVSAALLVLCGDRCIRIVRAHCTEGEFEGDSSWQTSFCGWTLSSHQPSVLVVNDTLQDARFSDNVHVQSGAIRFYCCAPLVSSTGHRLGTLALVDMVPRTFDTSCLQVLAHLAELTVRELELQIAQQQQPQQQQQDPWHVCQQPAAASAVTAAREVEAASAGLQQGAGTAERLDQQQQRQQQQHLPDSQLHKNAAVHERRLPPWMHAKQKAAEAADGGAAAAAAAVGPAGLCGEGVAVQQMGGQACTAAAGQELPQQQQQPRLQRHRPPLLQLQHLEHQQQQQQQQQQHEALYPLRLRAADTISSAVLLVDSSRAGWPILHANAACQQVLQQLCISSQQPPPQQQQQCTTSKPGQGGDHTTTSGSSSSKKAGDGVPGAQQQQQQQCNSDKAGRVPGVAAALAGDQHSVAQPSPRCFSSCSDNACSSSSNISGSSIVGKYIKDILDPLQIADMRSTAPCSSSGTMSQSMFLPNLPGLGSSGLGMLGASAAAAAAAAGWPLSFWQRVMLQTQGRQSFSLHNVKLVGSLSGAVVTLAFRCAGFSALEGAAPVCLPTSQPDASELSTALALQSLAAGRRCNSDDPSLGTAAASRCLYFVTIKPHKTVAAGGAAAAAAEPGGVSGYFGLKGRLGTPRPSERSSSGGSKSFSSGCNIRSQLVPVLVPCPFPQFAEDDAADKTTAAATARSSGSSSKVRTPSGVPNGGLQLQQCADLQVVTSADASLPACSAAADGVDVGSVLERVDSKHVFVDSACDQAAPSSSSSSSTPAVRRSKCSTAASCGSSSSRLLDGGFYSRCARLVCGRLPGLVLGGQIAAGTHGRVFRAEYSCMKTAVKVLDSSSNRLPLQPAAAAGSLSSSLKHANIVSTLAWAVVSQGPQQTAAAAAAAGDQQAVQSPAGCSRAAAEGCSRAGAAAAAAGGGGQTWLVQEYCDRGCLQDAIDCGWLRESRSCVSGEVDMLAVMATTAEVAAAMLLLHRADIVHGDLSAFNVLLSSSEPAAAVGGRGFVAKVTDFGLQQHFDPACLVDNPYCSIAHLAPEVLQHGLCTKAADVYSFGVLIFMMVTGSRAWAGLPHASIMEAVCTYKRQLAFPPEAPLPLTLLARACMALHPAERPCFADIVEILQPVNGTFLSS